MVNVELSVGCRVVVTALVPAGTWEVTKVLMSSAVQRSACWLPLE
jgi:hypothetical protein